MRLNKKKLAALAMSAVMAASAVPFPVYAEELSAGDDVVVSSEVVAEPITETPVVTPEVGKAAATVTGAKFEYNAVTGEYSGKLIWSNGVETSTTDIAQEDIKKEEKAATCTEGTTVVLSTVYDGKTWKENFEVGAALGHDMTGEEERIQTTAPTCTTEGEITIYSTCARPGCDHKEVKGTEVVPAAHSFTDEVKYEPVSNVKLDKDGKPVLIDTTLPGSYDVYTKCSKCGEFIRTKANVVINAETIAKAVVLEKENIATNLNDIAKNDPNAFPLDEEELELVDCSKEGKYTVRFYDGEGGIIGTTEFTVAPHHYNTYKSVVVDNKSKGLLNVKTNEDGSLAVENTSCSVAVEYTEVTHCSAAGCDKKAHTLLKNEVELPANVHTGKKNTAVVLTEKKTAEPTGKHVLDDAAKTRIAEVVKEGNVVYSALLDAAQESKYVQFDVPENICENGGVVTVKYLCKSENKVVETEDIKVSPEKHQAKEAAVENIVKATCQNAGSYDVVTRCRLCDKEMSKTTVKSPRLKHTNETAVGANKTEKDTSATLEFVGDKLVDDKGRYLDDKNWNIGKGNWAGYEKYGKTFRVVPTIYNNCTECNDHKVVISEVDFETFKIVEVQKEDSKGQNGYIVFEATYKKPLKDGGMKTETVKSGKIPYYSTMEAYTGRVEDAVLNGLHKDDDGVYRYYVNGELQKDYTGMIEDKGEKYLVVSGVLATDVNGLWHDDASDVWYFFVEGHVLANHTGVTLYDGEWFYVSNGKLDDGVTGLVPYNGGTFLFADGRLLNKVNGLWQDINNPADWYFLALGQVQTDYSGVAQYDGAFFVVENGKLDTDYNGTIEYDGAKFKVVNGQLITK